MPEQKKLRIASRGEIAKGSLNKLKEVFSKKGAGARSLNFLNQLQKAGFTSRRTTCNRTRFSGSTKSLTSSCAAGLARATEVIKFPSREQSK
jgi:hypothetical protein